MKLRVVLLALLIGAIAGLAFFIVKPEEDALVEVPPSPPPRVLPDPEPPPPPVPETDEQRAERLKHLDPALREAIIRLENSARQWENKNPDPGYGEWEEFLVPEIAKLETPQVLEIVAAIRLGEGAWLDRKFHFGILEAWAYREQAMARNDVVKTAEINGMLDGAGGFANRDSMERLSDDIHVVRRGYARRDPAAAWQELLDDLADPRRKNLSDELLWANILEFYAKPHPQEAWRDILSHPDLAFYLVPGFAMGAPPGQDWPARLADYSSLCRIEHGREAGGDRAIMSLLARWLAEDPDAALGWGASHLGMQDFLDYRGLPPPPPPKLPGLEMPSEDVVLQLNMMREAYSCFWFRHPLMTEILTALIAKGHRELAALAIADRLGRRWDRRLHPLIRSFPDPALREALLTTAVRKLPKPRGNSATREEVEEHLAVIYSLWTLSAEIEVSEETRSQAKIGLRRAYAAEQSAAAQRKSP